MAEEGRGVEGRGGEGKGRDPPYHEILDPPLGQTAGAMK